MPMVPFDRFCFSTTETPREVAARLVAAVAPRPRLGHARTELPLQGWTNGHDFLLLRVPHELSDKSGVLGMNSFVPEVRGRIVGTAEGTRIEGTMMLRPVILILVLVWTAAILGGFTALIFVGLRTGHWRWSDLLGLGAMLLFGTMLCLLSFSREARKTRDTLERVLNSHDPAVIAAP